MTEGPVLEAHGLAKHYRTRASAAGGLGRRGTVRAVDGVDLELRRGEVLALVGESGSGKSTVASMLMLLEHPTAGAVRLFGRDASSLSRREVRALRRRVQIVLQDPYASLDPRLRAGASVAEAFAVHPDLCERAERPARVRALLERVGLDAAYAERYPHELSGGQRQRVGIARALAVEPEVLICDEPTSALDVSVQAQVVNLLGELRAQLGLAMLFISHDLALVRQLADRVAVMRRGVVVESADAERLYAEPSHEYTRELLAAAPALDGDARPSAELAPGGG